MPGLDGQFLFFAFGWPALMWLLLRYQETLLGFRLPTDAKRRTLERAAPAVRFSAKHTRALRHGALALLVGAGWAMGFGFAWPYFSMALLMAGVCVWVYGVFWFIEFRRKR